MIREYTVLKKYAIDATETVWEKLDNLIKEISDKFQNQIFSINIAMSSIENGALTSEINIWIDANSKTVTDDLSDFIYDFNHAENNNHKIMLAEFYSDLGEYIPSITIWKREGLLC